MHIDEDEIRRRAYRIWEAEGRPPGKHDEHWERARADIACEFQRAVGATGDARHRMNPPLNVEEALNPEHWREEGNERGAP